MAGHEAPTTEIPHVDPGAEDPTLVRESHVPPTGPGTDIPLEQGLDKPAYWRPEAESISSDEVSLIANEHGRTIGQQIDASAEANGHAGDVQGLRLDMANGERFVVSGTYTTMRPITRMKMVSNFTDEPGGLETFLPKLVETKTRSVPMLRKQEGKKLPRLNMQGVLPRVYHHTTDEEPQMSLFNKKPGEYTRISRRRESLGQEPVRMVTVEVFDDVGDVTRIKTMKLDDLYAMAGEFGVGRASWDDRGKETMGTAATRIMLTDSINKKDREKTAEEKKHPKAFDQITAQLEDIGVTNWAGLTWERHSPGEVPGSSMTQEITLDTAVKDWDYNNPMWGRSFVLRTTHKTKDGTTVSDQVMSDGDLKHYLETADGGLTINKMRYVHREETEPAPAASEDPLARWYREEERAWAGLIPEDREQKPESDSKEAPDAHDPYMTIEDAYALLNYVDLPGTETQEGQERLRSRMHNFERTGGKKYAEELKRTLAEMGIDKFFELVDGIKAVYIADLKKFNINPGIEDESLSPAILGLMMKRLDKDSGDPVIGDLDGVKARRDVIDVLVGQKFAAETSKPSEKPTPEATGFVNKDKQPEYKNRWRYEFNESLWPALSVIVKGTLKKRRDSIWKPIEKMAHEIHEGNVVSIKEYRGRYRPVPPALHQKSYQNLGRMLRRTIGE